MSFYNRAMPNNGMQRTRHQRDFHQQRSARAADAGR
jgi:hypothetical protein